MAFDWAEGRENGAGSTPCLRGGDTAMDKSQNPTGPPDINDVRTFIRRVIATWKERGRKRFESDPELGAEAFEQFWPTILENFFLAETLRAVKVLRLLSRGHDN
jgi:hypothetical protein